MHYIKGHIVQSDFCILIKSFDNTNMLQCFLTCVLMSNSTLHPQCLCQEFESGVLTDSLYCFYSSAIALTALMMKRPSTKKHNFVFFFCTFCCVQSCICCVDGKKNYAVVCCVCSCGLWAPLLQHSHWNQQLFSLGRRRLNSGISATDQQIREQYCPGHRQHQSLV